MEQLCLEDLDIMTLDPRFGPFRWHGLKALVIRGLDIHDNDLSLLRIMTNLPNRNLQHLDLDFYWTSEFLERLMGETQMESDELFSGLHDGLRSFRCPKATIDPPDLATLIEESLESGNLRDLDITFPLDHEDVPMGRAHCEYLENLCWLIEEPSIRSLGVFNFRFHLFPKNTEELPLPNFLSLFPNLEVLEINSIYYEGPEFANVVAEVLKTTHLKTIYQSTVQGVALDRLRAVATQAGVELLWGERPREWPVRLAEETSFD